MKKRFIGRYELIFGNFIGVILIGVLGALVLSNIYLKSDKDDFGKVKQYSDGWVTQLGNKIEVPTTIKNAGRKVTIYNTIPKLYHTTTVCVRSSQQDITIKVDGVIRTDYTTKYTRMVGSNSASRYVFAELDPDDSYKRISITFETDSIYEGRINEILLGTSAAVVLEEFSNYIFSDIAVLVLLIVGIIALIFGALLNIRYREESPVFELGLVAMMTGGWKLCESRMRQFYFNSNSATANIAFIVLALLPIFTLRFVDRVFKRRYRKILVGAETCCFLVFVTEIILQFTNTYDFVETLTVTIVECALSLVVIIILLIYEIYKKRVKEYKFTAIGIGVFFIFAIVEIALVNTMFNGKFTLALGVAVLVVLTVIQEIKNILERDIAEHVKMQKHAEALSLQVVTTLSATVDAKDKYTNGHSNRVAEYSREIARRSGMSDKEVNEIYYMGLLHDIGKIAVPDTIINKDGKLTDEEFAQIKKHPAAGAEILKNVTEMPNLQIGARWHHEKYNGKGYPDGLSGEDIPVQARIIAVADSYDAMTSYRSYRDAMPQEKVYSEIENGKGSQFDPAFADIMLQMISEDKDYQMREHRD